MVGEEEEERVPGEERVPQGEELCVKEAREELVPVLLDVLLFEEVLEEVVVFEVRLDTV
jgi:hypothetical protein